MAKGYGPGLQALLNDNQGVTLQCLLIKTSGTYTFNRADSDLSASGIAADECDATNYARQSVTTTITWDAANGRIEIAFSDPTFAQLGGASNNNVDHCVVFITGADDANRKPVAYLDFTDTATNGNNFVVDMDQAEGQIRLPIAA